MFNQDTATELVEASPEAIQELLARIEVTPKGTRKKAESQALTDSKPPKTLKKSRPWSIRCACRVCPSCLETQRWERIYAEKFEDKTYYDGLPFRLGGSSLAR